MKGLTQQSFKISVFLLFISMARGKEKRMEGKKTGLEVEQEKEKMGREKWMWITEDKPR